MAPTNALESIKYYDGKLEILDQLKLPLESVYIPVNTVQDGFDVIRNMQVRGAPAIAIVGCLSLAIELNSGDFATLPVAELVKVIKDKLEFLVTSRPTAVNLQKAATFLTSLIQSSTSLDSKALIHKLTLEIEKMLEKDRADNKAVGEFGAEHILSRLLDSDSKVQVLTHCNTGSLATAGYGTALGVIRSLFSRGRLEKAFYTETRPYNQGARLTGYELIVEGIPSTLICDSMAGILMKTKKIAAVITGADRVARNGDVANKVGTLVLAILAKQYGVPFYVAVPVTSFDPNIPSGEEIKIEERPWKEMTSIKGIETVPTGTECWNPAFDVTDASLVTGGYITELGVFTAPQLAQAVSLSSSS